MHPLFAQLLRRRPANPFPVPFPATHPAPGPAARSPSGIVVSMSRPARRADTAWAAPVTTSVDIMLDDLGADPLDLSPGTSPQDGVRLRIDPKDHRRVRISGNMREVCAALDALIAVQ